LALFAGHQVRSAFFEAIAHCVAEDTDTIAQIAVQVADAASGLREYFGNRRSLCEEPLYRGLVDEVDDVVAEQAGLLGGEVAELQRVQVDLVAGLLAHVDDAGG
jgi:hypothetical protein